MNPSCLGLLIAAIRMYTEFTVFQENTRLAETAQYRA
jgi:hypothetical protein